MMDYGVCRLSVVGVRKEPKGTSEQVTQLLFGDHYEVLEISADKEWIRIRIYADQCEGWLDWRQHHTISEEYYNQINKTDYKITTDIASPVLYKKSPLTIVMGSIVPISSSELFKVEEQFAFNGESKGLGQRRDIDFLITTAKKYLYSPYQGGGKSPFGIDHDGFVQMVFKISGYPLQRDIRQQAAHGKKVGSIDETKPGDIAFFTAGKNIIAHCGIILEGKRIIHCLGRVRIDGLTEQGILNPDGGGYSYVLHSVRKVTT